ncbi:alpha-L-rhamnosidase C-terminal domain-containing protein [Nonomuraea sp. NPDC049784]|uniref:alpha-L-rhamnosidase C-terminal domain-containing protein n=1 Tax=Nonomuraea sp. NPDC049784 TaxID=3154361 RepID=UPI0033F9116D
MPAYRRFEVRPQPGSGMTAAEARLDTPYGPIGASWWIVGDTFTIDAQRKRADGAAVKSPRPTQRSSRMWRACSWLPVNESAGRIAAVGDCTGEARAFDHDGTEVSRPSAFTL